MVVAEVLWSFGMSSYMQLLMALYTHEIRMLPLNVTSAFLV